MAEQHLDTGGNPQVDFVWGNMPMQNNYGRNDSWNYFGGGTGDHGWDGTWIQTSSDTLNTSYTVFQANGYIPLSVGTNHTMVYDGYSNFPGFIPNYAGDEDSGLETTVPVIVGLNRIDAQNALNAAFLDWDYEWTSVSAYGITADLNQSSDAIVYLNGDYWKTAGLKVGDKLWFDWYDGSGYSKVVTIKEKNDGDSTLLVTFVDGPFNDIDTSEPYNKSVEIEGVIYSYDSTTYGRVLAVDTPPAAGDIVDEGTGIYFYVLND